MTVSLLLMPGAASGQDGASTGDAADYVASIRPNVVFLRAGPMTGFGFVVGLAERSFLVATARHTVERDGHIMREPTVCFLDQAPPCGTGELRYLADAVDEERPELDLAVVRVPYPDDAPPWRPDVQGGRPDEGMPVRVIGRAREWYVPPEPGRVADPEEPGSTVAYRGLSVAAGVSGAPVVTASGIVAMHVESAGDDGVSRGVSIAAIRDRVQEQMRGEWVLVPRAECEEAGAARSSVAGRRIAIHFQWRESDAALASAATLHCIGARVDLRPVWRDASWAGDGIEYGSGDLALARSLQATLLDHGRLDTRLGDPSHDVEIWIP